MPLFRRHGRHRFCRPRMSARSLGSRICRINLGPCIWVSVGLHFARGDRLVRRKNSDWFVLFNHARPAIDQNLLTGISILILWRLVAKQILHHTLPTLIRISKPYLALPRRYYEPSK